MQISPYIQTGEFDANGIKLGHSSFNLDWMKELGIENPKVIFDIGAYDAGDAIRFKQKWPEARVFSFEADPDRAEKIRKYIGKFDISFHEHAVMNFDGTEKFYQSICELKDAGDTHKPGEVGGQGSLYKHSHTYRLIYKHIEQQKDFIFVSAIKLRSFCIRNSIKEIDLLHVDVEGAELDVLFGMGDYNPKVIWVETLYGMFEDAPDARNIYSYLSHKGYTLVADFKSEQLYIYKG